VSFLAPLAILLDGGVFLWLGMRTFTQYEVGKKERESNLKLTNLKKIISLDIKILYTKFSIGCQVSRQVTRNFAILEIMQSLRRIFKAIQDYSQEGNEKFGIRVPNFWLAAGISGGAFPSEETGFLGKSHCSVPAGKTATTR